MTTQELLQKARGAKTAMALASTETKNKALSAMADALERHQAEILAANQLDLDAARGTISSVMLDRLALNPDRISGMAKGIREVVELPDPAGAVLNRVERPSGIVVEKTAVPMGVIAIIYESRPNVTSDAAALALKAGSACVLRGGKEAHRSAAAIVAALKEGLSAAGLPEDALQLVEDTTRASSNELMTATGYVDLLIPRGGAGLIRACVDNATVPVIETGVRRALKREPSEDDELLKKQISLRCKELLRKYMRSASAHSWSTGSNAPPSLNNEMTMKKLLFLLFCTGLGLPVAGQRWQIDPDGGIAWRPGNDTPHRDQIGRAHV